MTSSFSSTTDLAVNILMTSLITDQIYWIYENLQRTSWKTSHPREHCTQQSATQIITIFFLSEVLNTIMYTTKHYNYYSWLHSTVAERRSFTGELSLSCA